MKSRIIHGECLEVLRSMPDASIDLVYVDPPFNTGRVQKRERLRTVRDDDGGDRKGFAGRRYRTERLGVDSGYADSFDDYLAFLEPRLREAHRVLTPSGSLYFHIDYREVHYCKILLDRIFGRASFINEIIWAYDYGARTKKRWPAKHDNILFFAKNPRKYHFDVSEVDRIPYMAPGLVGPEKAARGKLPTDTWWHTIVSPTGKEKLGYPTQKPLGILRRIVRASVPKGGVVLDFFAGSGTTGQAALEHGASFILVDRNETAIETMKRRFAMRDDVVFETAAMAVPGDTSLAEGVEGPSLIVGSESTGAPTQSKSSKRAKASVRAKTSTRNKTSTRTKTSTRAKLSTPANGSVAVSPSVPDQRLETAEDVLTAVSNSKRAEGAPLRVVRSRAPNSAAAEGSTKPRTRRARS